MFFWKTHKLISEQFSQCLLAVFKTSTESVCIYRQPFALKVKFSQFRNLIVGGVDFLGYNIYSAVLVTHKVLPLTPMGYYEDQDLEQINDPSWQTYKLNS